MKTNYKVIKNILSKDICDFVNNYFLLKEKVFNTLKNRNLISPFDNSYGMHDDQVPNAYSHYSDPAMETILTLIKPKIEKEIDTKLIETYTYARIYRSEDKLVRHKDRPSCALSGTLNLGGDTWPIYLDDNTENGHLESAGYAYGVDEGIEVILNPGDILIYKGCQVEHWRRKFKGNYCTQVFLHYNDLSQDDALNNKYDKREHLGLPSFSKD